MADTVARAWASRAASVETRIEAVAIRARAMAARLRAQDEQVRSKALRLKFPMTARAPRMLTLQEAEDAYLVRFGKGAPVWTFLGHADLLDVLLEAVEHGQPWTTKTLGERLNMSPSGALIGPSPKGNPG
ncbi:hypothetical protein E2C06_31080 [Dankookia rubra]|uniref:Uncharacterized protein n=1 Tax=Dankookia rubra TaxID=1442381 RepID=A0A4R5Q770_9PROT|nr:hypothetical protein [Dankookia rubra]TDH58732.1 hypothetical protein E2C06_31080 [Dankookia rubra]